VFFDLEENIVTTGVDSLLDLLKGVSKISIIEAAEKLGVGPGIVQSWVDFLVEEEIVGIEYKFTKPLIYLNKSPDRTVITVENKEDFDWDYFKNDFWKRAEERKIPENKIDFFWKNHLKETIFSKKDVFYREARKRKLNNIDSVWNEYVNSAINP
jgi:hypothetical protein